MANVSKFKAGDEVEVYLEREDSNGVWFPATVVKYSSDNSYSVKHWYKKPSGEALLQNSTITSLTQIRPTPPLGKRNKPFVLSDKVDAFYDFAWTSGSITKVFDNKKFMVSFDHNNNALVFSETKLRPHMDWVDGKWIHEFEANVADNDASLSSPLIKKSEIENEADITTSTGCETDATKTETPINQTDAASKIPSNVSSLKPKSPSPDDKVTEGKKVKELNNITTLSLKRRGRTPTTPQSSKRGNQRNAGAVSDKVPNITELILALAHDSPQSKGRRQSRKKGSQTELVSEPTVADKDASNLRPLKKSKIENEAEIAASAIYETNTRTKKAPFEEKSSSKEPKTPTSTVRQTGPEAPKRPRNLSSSKTPDDKVIKEKKVIGLKNCTTESQKRPVRLPRTPHSSKGGKGSNAGAKAAEGKNEKVDNPEDVTALNNDGTKSPQQNINKEESKTSVSDPKGGEGHNPAELVIEETPKNNQREEMEKSEELSRSRSKKEIATKSNEKTKRAVSSEDQQEKSSSNKRGKTTSVDPSAKSQHSSLDGVSREETGVCAAAIDNNPSVRTNVNETLPFVKTVALWECIESTEIYKSIPQKPHFRPLENSDEFSREVLAIGHMVTFLKIANKIPELQLDMPRSSIKKYLDDLAVLEDNGFDVKPVRDRLNDLLIKKNKHELLQNDLKEYENQITECKNKKTKMDEAVDEIDKKLAELKAKREAVMWKREIMDGEIAASQLSADNITNVMKSMHSDFKDLAAADW